MSKTVIVCSDSEPKGIIPTLVNGAAAAAMGDEVLIYFNIGAASALAKGEIEKMRGIEGLPDPVELYDAILLLDGKMVMCELGLPFAGIKEEDLREGIEVVGAATFLSEAEGADTFLAF